MEVKHGAKIDLFHSSQSVVALIFSLWVISSVAVLAPGQLTTLSYLSQVQ